MLDHTASAIRRRQIEIADVLREGVLQDLARAALQAEALKETLTLDRSVRSKEAEALFSLLRKALNRSRELSNDLITDRFDLKGHS